MPTNESEGNSARESFFSSAVAAAAAAAVEGSRH